MPQAILDHLVVAARQLEDGVRHVADALGVEPVPGGRHERLGTHNAVLRLGDTTYLEVIAIDPDADPPDMKRWFDLDGEVTQALLAERPRLLTWIARCDDLEACCAAADWPTGTIHSMRRGDMTWQIAFRADGHLNAGGLLPLLIEWDAGVDHPAGKLPDAGCSLAALRGLHPHPGTIGSNLAAIGLDSAIELHEADDDMRLEAEIETPDGRRTLM